MASFKKLSKSDVTLVPYYANKQWNLSYCPYPTSSEYLTIYKGTNITGSFSPDDDLITENQYERLVYSQINQLFYQKYTTQLNTSSLANSIYYESASVNRPTSSYFIYNDSARLIENFPTGIMEGIRVLAINQNLYGDKVLPNHFQLSSSAYNIIDDGYGNLFDSASSNIHVGNLFYAHGLGIITNQDYQMIFPLPPIAKNDYGNFSTTDTKIISASLNDYARSGTLNTSSLSFSGSTSGPEYSWTTSSNGTIILTTTTAGTYSVWYTIGADIAGSCSTQLRSNKAKITATVISSSIPPEVIVPFTASAPDGLFGTPCAGSETNYYVADTWYYINDELYTFGETAYASASAGTSITIRSVVADDYYAFNPEDTYYYCSPPKQYRPFISASINGITTIITGSIMTQGPTTGSATNNPASASYTFTLTSGSTYNFISYVQDVTP